VCVLSTQSFACLLDNQCGRIHHPESNIFTIPGYRDIKIDPRASQDEISGTIPFPVSLVWDKVTTANIKHN
jgi:hypothetical protein